MYYDFTVPIPQLKGKITRMKKGKLTYIQLETGRSYLPDRQYTIPVRVSIGKLDPNIPDRSIPTRSIWISFPRQFCQRNVPRLTGVVLSGLVPIWSFGRSCRNINFQPFWKNTLAKTVACFWIWFPA